MSTDERTTPKPLSYDEAKRVLDKAIEFVPALGMSRTEFVTGIGKPHERKDSIEAAPKPAPLTPEQFDDVADMVRKAAGL